MLRFVHSTKSLDFGKGIVIIMRYEEEIQIKLKDLRTDYYSISVPTEGLTRVKERMEEAKQLKIHLKNKHRCQIIGGSIAAALALIIALPNTNQSIAKAMEKIPVVGSIVKVITFRDYDYDDNNYHAHVTIPQIEEDGTPYIADITDNTKANQNATSQINKDIADYAQTLINQFEADVKADKNSEGHQGLDFSYKVITDTPEWFTLKIDVVETAASGYQYSRYYHINKSTNEIITLKDLFQEDSDYLTIISDSIKEQMREQMKEKGDEAIYWIDQTDFPENNFESIQDDQNFYFKNDGSLVIAFDEYEVAPGFMGCPEFVIPSSLLESISK